MTATLSEPVDTEPARPASRRRTVLVRVAATIAVLALWAGCGRFASARHSDWELQSARASDLQREQEGEHRAAVSANRDADGLDSDIATNTRDAGQAEDDTRTALAEHDALLASIEALNAQIEARKVELAAAGKTASEQAITLIGLQTCLDGIRKASFAGMLGDNSTGVAEMKRVEDVCIAAFRVLGIGGTSGFAFDFADPYVVQVGTTYYAYATNAGAGAVQLISSPDLQRWTLVGEALGALPAWAEAGRTWAPSVARVGAEWVLYYTVRERASGLQCISSAVATAPTGPFVDDSKAPLICQRDLGGSIDPSPYVSKDGIVFLVWKSDAIVRGKPARLWSVPLDETGRKPAWFPIELARADRDWEGRVIEGPSMFEHAGKYYVLYSGNHWGTERYATGYLVCDSPLGPCRKPADNVVLRSHGTQKGTGGAETFLADGLLTVAYHAWEGTDIGYPNKRRIHTAPISFDASGRPVIAP